MTLILASPLPLLLLSEPASLGQTHTPKTDLPAAESKDLSQTHTVKANLPAAESAGLGQTHTVKTDLPAAESAGLGQTHTVKTDLPAATPTGLGQTQTVRANPPAAESTGLGQTHTIRTREQNLAAAAAAALQLQLSTDHTPSAASSSSSSHTPTNKPHVPPMNMQARSHPCAGPPTPAELSPREPNFSRSISGGGGEHHLEYTDEPFRDDYNTGSLSDRLRLPDVATEMDVLNQSALASKKQLSAAEEKCVCPP